MAIVKVPYLITYGTPLSFALQVSVYYMRAQNYGATRHRNNRKHYTRNTVIDSKGKQPNGVCCNLLCSIM